MKKKMTFGITIIILLIIGLQMSSKDLVQICVIGDFSQSSSSSSIDVFRSVELAIEEINSVEEQYQLTRLNANLYDDNDALRNAILSANYDFIIGPETSSRFLKYQDALNALDIPVFLIAVSSDTINNIDDNYFRLASSIEDQTARIISVLDNQIESQALDIFYSSENFSFSKTLALSVKSKWDNGDKASSLYEVGDISQKDIQEKLKTTKIGDSAFIIAGPGQAGIIAQLITKNNPDCTILFPAWSFSERTTEYIANIPNDFYSLSIPPPKKNEHYSEFSEALYSLKGVQSNLFSIYGYESIYLIDYAIENTKSTKLEDIKDFIHKMDSYEGKFNDFELNNFGDGSRGYSLFKIQEGEFKLLIDKME